MSDCPRSGTVSASVARAEAAGLHLSAEGDRLRLHGREPDAALLAELRDGKPALMAVLVAREATRQAELSGYRHAALQRPPAWGATDGAPPPGAWCGCCRSRQRWSEAVNPTGWRCATCHPGGHLPTAKRREVAT